MKNSRAIFPGTFDPVTIGHYSVVLRALELFDEVIVCIGSNQSKQTVFSSDTRLALLRQAFSGLERVRVEKYDCLTVDFAAAAGAQYIVRGIRSVVDFEYEKAAAEANRLLTGVETVVLFTEEQYACVSSSLVRDLIRYGGDVARFLPPGVCLP